MVTERYHPAHGALDAAQGAIRTMTALRLARWARRWVVLLPAALLLSLLDPVIAPLRYWALGLAGVHLAFILVTGWGLRRALGGSGARVIDVTPTGRSPAGEGDVIDLTAIGGPDERAG